jgi:Xaa-Pro aminopeptidase
VLRVRQIFIAALGGVEAHDEAVSEAVVEAFIALIRAVFDAEKARDLTDHAREFAEAFVDLFFSDFREKLEYAVVSDHGFGRVNGE